VNNRNDPIPKILKIVTENKICDTCLGRLYGQLSHGLTNKERGKSLRVTAGLAANKGIKEPETCDVCEGLHSNLDKWVEKAIEKVKNYEFHSFLFGNRLEKRLIQNQISIEKKYKLENSENFSHSINRLLGKHFRDELESRGLQVEANFETPDITILVDFRNQNIKTTVRSVYIYGRYLKLARGIPQTIFPCPKCGGSGCEECSYTGKAYPTSVEEIVSPPAQELSRAGSTVFHGAGREDIDVLCLGQGRPFVLELENPKIRKINLYALTEKINEDDPKKVKVNELKIVTKNAVQEIKAAKPDKIYRAVVKCDREITDGKLDSVLATIEGRVFQRTPTRVAHRRADKIRAREVFKVKGKRISKKRYQIILWAESGLYIKELFTAGGNEILPAPSELLKAKLTVKELDVLDIPGCLKEGSDQSYHFHQDEKNVEEAFAGIN